MEIGIFGYSGEFHFMAMVTLNMIIYKETGQLLFRYQLNKDFFSQSYVQPNFNTWHSSYCKIDFTMFFRMLDRNVKCFLKKIQEIRSDLVLAVHV